MRGFLSLPSISPTQNRAYPINDRGAADNALFLPAHYVKQFHADFNDDAAALATELGFETWVNMFNNRRAQGYFWGSDTNFYAPYKPEQWYIVQ